ncbi:HIT family protein [Psychrobacillus psychrodurans]|uniref:HIT family protein n=1 Tax=Psychrobacillus psychrodurans TaxID=126157 RepID=UPI0008E4DDA5|nr:HIT domain-containing protein [Psychrobacillus psychrodurans]MCZ8541886.1 HIT domain-containing protein [Psychrobacillus psychrodurans]SFN11063.1 histidine triad (HIT) family protein [Psychrobacillus psychrodurans]
MKDCIFCNLELEPTQKVILSNEYCMFLQLEQAQEKGIQLEGAGLIIPKKHRETAFDLTIEEWNATYTLLHDVKKFLDEMYQPQGYNLGWNCGEIGGQHIFHSHFHVLPRYEDEPLAGKGIRYMFKSADNKRINYVIKR